VTLAFVVSDPFFTCGKGKGNGGMDSRGSKDGLVDALSLDNVTTCSGSEEQPEVVISSVIYYYL